MKLALFAARGPEGGVSTPNTSYTCRQKVKVRKHGIQFFQNEIISEKEIPFRAKVFSRRKYFRVGNVTFRPWLQTIEILSEFNGSGGPNRENPEFHSISSFLRIFYYVRKKGQLLVKTGLLVKRSLVVIPGLKKVKNSLGL